MSARPEGESLPGPRSPASAGRPDAARAVMASRVSPPDALDYFPTPPWATRALLPVLGALDPRLGERDVWEPACGEGHMASVLAEAFASVSATDVFDYSGGDPHFIPGASPGWRGTADFPLVAAVTSPGSWDWVVTNPPFNLAVEFAHAGLRVARRGLALLVRTQWLAGGERSGRWPLFARRPPRLVAQYAERVPMHRGRWEPGGSTATDYCWVVWTPDRPVERTELVWIPPGQRERLTRPEDLTRFAAPAAAGGLFGGGGA